MSKKELKVCWLSAGVSSFVAGYLKKDSIDLYIYIDIENQHPDSMRFIKDCEKILGKEILILKSPYRNKENVIRQFRYINGPSGAKCTEILKKRVRKEWEMEHREYQITYVWGFDMDERRRAERICEAMPEFKHEFPLIEKNLTKQDAHAITARLHVKRPVTYDMGFLLTIVLDVSREACGTGIRSANISRKYSRQWPNWKEKSVIVVSTVSFSMNWIRNAGEKRMKYP